MFCGPCDAESILRKGGVSTINGVELLIAGAHSIASNEEISFRMALETIGAPEACVPALRVPLIYHLHQPLSRKCTVKRVFPMRKALWSFYKYILP